MDYVVNVGSHPAGKYIYEKRLALCAYVIIWILPLKSLMWQHLTTVVLFEVNDSSRPLKL
jgi:hypothetical protein